MLIVIVKFHQISPANSFPVKLTGLTVHSVELLLRDWILPIVCLPKHCTKVKQTFNLRTYVPESKPAVLVGLIYNNFHRQIPSGSTGKLLLAPLTGLTIQLVSQVRRDWI